jgi:hypothetical protein
MNKLHGHATEITAIRILESRRLMATLSTDGVICIWGFNDTDVYDPNLLIKFVCQMKGTFRGVDWLDPDLQLIVYDGKRMGIMDVPPNSRPRSDPTIRWFEAKWHHENDQLIYFRIICDLSGGLLLCVIFPFDVYFILIRGGEKHELKHIHSDSAEPILMGTKAFICRLLPFAGAVACVWADRRAIYISRLESSTVTAQNMNKVIGYKKSIQFDEDICGLCIAHPGYVFVTYDSGLYICSRLSSADHTLEILQKIPLGYRPLKIACISTGFVSLVGEGRFEFYFPIRRSFRYLQSSVAWTLVGFEEDSGVISALEWTIDGLLLYAKNNQLYCFTKFMDTFFLDVSYQKLPTIHHSLSYMGRMIHDSHPSNLIPLAVSGRFNMILQIFRFLDENWEKKECQWFCSNIVLTIPQESEDNSALLSDESIPGLLARLSQKVDQSPITDFSPSENNQLKCLLETFMELISIPFDAIDSRGLLVVRAHKLNPAAPLPFDLLVLALLSQDQRPLFSLLNLKTWEAVRSSGVSFGIMICHR